MDVALLKVSAKSLGLNWEEEFENMMDASSYIHISDNDGFHDLNNQLEKSSNLLSMISNSNTTNKDFTIEVYGEMSLIKSSYDLLRMALI